MTLLQQNQGLDELCEQRHNQLDVISSDLFETKSHCKDLIKSNSDLHENMDKLDETDPHENTQENMIKRTWRY